MIDTHAHLQGPEYDADRDAVVERARATGVETMIVVGCDLEDSRRARAVAAAYGFASAVGIHPHEARHAPADLIGAFDDLFADGSRPIAIGEIGLDYHYDHSPRDVQREVLTAQLRIARTNDLPVIFHQREAFDDFVSIVERERDATTRGVVHCFTGNTAEAQRATKGLGLYLGIGGVCTFKSAEALRAAIVAVGLERLVLETDCPYLAPVPYRGRRNEPAFVAQVAATLAQLFDCPLEEVATTTTRNARALFSMLG